MRMSTRQVDDDRGVSVGVMHRKAQSAKYWKKLQGGTSPPPYVHEYRSYMSIGVHAVATFPSWCLCLGLVWYNVDGDEGADGGGEVDDDEEVDSDGRVYVNAMHCNAHNAQSANSRKNSKKEHHHHHRGGVHTYR
jgi:hypothetical protein